MSVVIDNIPLLIKVLRNNTQLLVKLNQLLLQERQFIKRSDHQGIAVLLEKKRTLLDTIQQAERSLFKSFIFSADTLTELTANLPEALKTSFMAARLQLKNTLLETQQLNKINRQIVAYSQYSLDHLLNILRGGQPQQTLYQADGKTRSYTHLTLRCEV